MILIIDFGLSNLKYSLWHEDSLLKISIRERTDKTDFALEKLLEKTYNEYVEFASNYLNLPRPTKEAIEKVLIIASKHPEQTKAKVFTVDYVKEDMRNDIKTTLKDRVSVESSNVITVDNSSANKKSKKKNENKTNVYNYSEQIVDDEFNYIQNILGVACNTDYLYKLTIAAHGAGISNYSILDPAQVFSRLAPTTEPTLVLDIGYNSYFTIVTSDVMEDGSVINNVIKNNDAIKIGSRVIDDVLLNKGYTPDEIWNEKTNNTYNDLESALNINYMDIVDVVTKEILSFTESTKRELVNVVFTGGAINQLNLKEYFLENIKGIRAAKNSSRVDVGDNYKLKVIDPYKDNGIFKHLPEDIRNYFYTSYAAYTLYNDKSNPDNYSKFQQGKMIDYLDTESKFLGSFKAVDTFRKLSKLNVVFSVILFTMCIGICAQWYLYKNLSAVYGDKAASLASEKQAITTQISQIDSELTTIEQDLLTETYDWSKVTSAIALATPTGVEITSILTGDGGDTDTIVIRGFSNARFKIADMTALLKDSIFNTVEIQEIKSSETLVKNPIQEFTIKCEGKKE